MIGTPLDHTHLNNYLKMTQLPRFVGMNLNQWESILEIISSTDDPDNWYLSEIIKDQIYLKEEQVQLPDIKAKYKTVGVA